MGWIKVKPAREFRLKANIVRGFKDRQRWAQRETGNFLSFFQTLISRLH